MSVVLPFHCKGQCPAPNYEASTRSALWLSKISCKYVSRDMCRPPVSAKATSPERNEQQLILWTTYRMCAPSSMCTSANPTAEAVWTAALWSNSLHWRKNVGSNSTHLLKVYFMPHTWSMMTTGRTLHWGLDIDTEPNTSNLPTRPDIRQCAQLLH